MTVRICRPRAWLWFFLAASLLGMVGCQVWLDTNEDVSRAFFTCSRDPGAPGCTPAGWDYKPGMGP
jgi:hypothetical protein